MKIKFTGIIDQEQRDVLKIILGQSFLGETSKPLTTIATNSNQITMSNPNILIAAIRYEKIRKLTPRQYSKMWNSCIINDQKFDDAVDALPEPYCPFFDEHPSGKDEECDEQDHRRL